MSSYTSSARLARDTRRGPVGCVEAATVQEHDAVVLGRSRKARSSGWTFFFRYSTASSPMVLRAQNSKSISP
jgi:hypothetical protein